MKIHILFLMIFIHLNNHCSQICLSNLPRELQNVILITFVTDDLNTNSQHASDWQTVAVAKTRIVTLQKTCKDWRDLTLSYEFMQSKFMNSSPLVRIILIPKEPAFQGIAFFHGPEKAKLLFPAFASLCASGNDQLIKYTCELLKRAHFIFNENASSIIATRCSRFRNDFQAIGIHFTPPSPLSYHVPVDPEYYLTLTSISDKIKQE